MAGAEPAPSYTIFQGHGRLLQGDRPAVLQFLQSHEQQAQGSGSAPPLWVFDDHSGMRLDLDWRSELAASPAPGQAAAPRSVGRPKLGVVAREVTLLPRHWEWLNRQPGGASGALRRLVDEARGKHAAQDAVRAATEAAYRFMSEMAGDLPPFRGRQPRPVCTPGRSLCTAHRRLARGCAKLSAATGRPRVGGLTCGASPGLKT